MLPTKEEAQNVLPIQHVSYSSMKSYLEDQNDFYKTYVRWEWDDREVSPSLVVWNAVHYWIELLRRAVKKDMNEEERKHLKKMVKENEPDARERRNGYLIDIVQWQNLVEEAKTLAVDEIQKAESKDCMKRWKTWSAEKSLADIERTFKEYVINAPFYKPLHVENNEIFEFYDADWKVMPLPIKAKIDLIGYDVDDRLIVVDHKTVTKSYEVDQKELSAAFDMQAWTYYLWCFAICGKAPDEIRFDQVFKWELKPRVWYWPKKDELQKMCSDNNVEFNEKDTVVVLKEKVLDAGIVKKPTRIQPYVITFDKTTRPISVFYKAYYSFIVDLYYRVKNELPFLVNPFKMYSADATYKDRLWDELLSSEQK